MIKRHQTNVELLALVPPEIPAGTTIKLTIKVSCSSQCNLQGRKIQVLSADNSVVSEAHLDTETSELSVMVPPTAGTHVFQLTFPAQGDESVLHEASSTPLILNVVPHKTSLAIWDVPSPVLVDNCAKLKVGVSCASGCCLENDDVEIRNEAGVKVGSGKLGPTLWPGTAGLYWTDVEFAAPAHDGTSSWIAVLNPTSHELPHDPSAHTFTFVTVAPAEHAVTVEVVEKNAATPLGEAEVRLGVYRASTDPSGSARLQVAGGTYELNVWKLGYELSSALVDVSRDLTLQVELVLEPPEEDKYWMG